MPPYVAETPRATQAKANRPTPVVPRIVPAVPLKLSRSAQGSQTATPPLNTPPASSGLKTEAGEHADDGKEDATETGPQSPVASTSKESVDVEKQAEEQGFIGSSEASSEAAPTSSIPDEATNGSTATLPSSGEVVPPIETQQDTSKPITRIPRELPPPFYPSTEGLSTPNSTTSSTAAYPSANNTVTMHHPRPSANRIVFGGYPDSSSSSPAPPSAGMMPYPPPLPLGYLPPGYAPAPFFAPGHAPHLSDHNAGLIYPPMGMPPANGYGYRRDQQPHAATGRQQQWMLPESPLPYAFQQYSPRHIFPPGNGNLDPHSRSGSQASTRTQDREGIRPSQSQLRGEAQVQNGNSNNQPKESHPETSFRSLQDHLLSQFGIRDFADCVLQISQGEAQPSVMDLYAHSVVASRSPVLMSAILGPGALQVPDQGLKVVSLIIPSNLFNSSAFTSAMRFLYGGRPLSEHGLELGLPAFDERAMNKDDFNPARERMDQAIAYTFAGQALDVQPIVSSGVEAIKKLLRWDTVEKALEFSLDTSNMPAKPGQQSGNLLNPSVVDTYRTKLLGTIVEYLVYSFPKGFSLNLNAPQLAAIPLLPSVVDARPMTHHPRLSQIQFGELPPEASETPSYVVTLLSSILFTLPHFALKRLLEHHALGARLGWEKLAEVMRSVTDEREKRRQKVATSKAAQNDSGTLDDSLWQNVHFEESLEPSSQHGSGYRLTRKQITPDSTVPDAGKI